MYPFLAFCAFILLLVLSQVTSRVLSGALFRLIRHEGMVIRLLAVVFLPGVIVHELGHFFVASMLLVQTGEIEFMPVVQGHLVKLGSVAVAKTDMVRRFLIGVAPVIFGIALMLGLFWFLSPIVLGFNPKSLLFLFLLFEIGNTMFSSKKDLEGAIGVVIMAVIFAFASYFFGLPIPGALWASLGSQVVGSISQEIFMFLLIVCVMDLLIIAGLSIIMKRLRS